MPARNDYYTSLETIAELPEFYGQSFSSVQHRADGQWHDVGANERFRIMPSDSLPKDMQGKLPFKLEVVRR